MAQVLRIRDWTKHYENNRTRNLKRMAWVPILNVAYLFRLAGMSWAWMLLALFLWIPIVGFIVSLVLLFALVTAWWRIAERRNKPGALALLMPIPVVNVFVGFYIAYSR